MYPILEEGYGLVHHQRPELMFCGCHMLYNTLCRSRPLPSRSPDPVSVPGPSSSSKSAPRFSKNQREPIAARHARLSKPYRTQQLQIQGKIDAHVKGPQRLPTKQSITDRHAHRSAFVWATCVDAMSWMETKASGIRGRGSGEADKA
jgi:hypothetical protein